MPILGKPLIRTNELVNMLTARVSKKLNRESTDREWTRVVLDELRRLGKERGCAVAPDRDADELAFMLDQIWWRNAERNDIALAVESEWGSNRAVWHDFGKLLVVKAPVKLMIYGTIDHQKEGPVMLDTLLQKYMRKFSHHISGENYVCLEFAVPQRSIYAYNCRITANGPLRGANFEEVLKAPIKWGNPKN